MADDTARASITRRVDLELADAFTGGWRELIVAELDRMRRDMPYADTIQLTMICERKRRG